MLIGDILKKIGELLSRHEERAHSVNSDLNPVLLVPGIGGSILNAVSENGSKERVWVRLFAADAAFRAKLYSKFDPETGKTVSLDKSIKIEVPDDRHGLYSCDILDPDVIIRMETVYYFHDLIEKMLSWGYEEGNTLFGFGYDFRQSIRLPEVLDALKHKLKKMHKISGKKVNIISHSMGGLLVKSFLALHHDVFEKYVDTWIAVAAPFQGAPGYIMDCLLTGVEFVKGWQRELFITKWSTHQMLIECPSIYELMAAPNFKWKQVPQLQVWHKKVDENGEDTVKLESCGPGHCIDLMKAALKQNTLTFQGDSIPAPFNTAILELSNLTREIMRSAKIPKGVKFYNIYGTSNETPFDVRYGTQDMPIESLSDILHTDAEFSCVDGDGTVPVESSRADELEAEDRIGIAGDHRGILNEDRLFRILKHWLKAGDADPYYDPDDDYVILPTIAEYYSQVESDDVGTDEYVAAVVTVSVRAEAHATVDAIHHNVSTVGVAEGKDETLRNQALEEAISAASAQAIAASS